MLRPEPGERFVVEARKAVVEERRRPLRENDVDDLRVGICCCRIVSRQTAASSGSGTASPAGREVARSCCRLAVVAFRFRSARRRRSRVRRRARNGCDRRQGCRVPALSRSRGRAAERPCVPLAAGRRQPRTTTGRQRPRAPLHAWHQRGKEKPWSQSMTVPRLASIGVAVSVRALLYASSQTPMQRSS